MWLCLLGGWEGGRVRPAFFLPSRKIRQKARMKDRMGNTLKPQERVLAFVSALLLRRAPGASESRERPHPHYSRVPARVIQSPPWAPRTSSHLLSDVSPAASFFQLSHSPSHPQFFQMSPAALEPGFPPCLLIPLDPGQVTEPGMACMGFEGW